MAVKRFKRPRPERQMALMEVRITIPTALARIGPEDCLAELEALAEGARREGYRIVNEMREKDGKAPWPSLGEHVPRSPPLTRDLVQMDLGKLGWKLTASMPAGSPLEAPTWLVEFTRHERTCPTLLREADEVTCLCGEATGLPCYAVRGFDETSALSIAWWVLKSQARDESRIVVPGR